MPRRTCGLCGEISKSTQSLKKHILEHHKVDWNDYLKYTHHGKLVGECILCGKPCGYNIRGYSKFCSTSCQMRDRYDNETCAEKDQRRQRLSDSWTQEKRDKQSEAHIKLNTQHDSAFYDNRHTKAKLTKLEKYDDENYGGFGSDRHNEAMVEKYGTDNIRKTKEYYQKYCSGNADKIRATCANTEWEYRDNNLEKRKATCISRYGVEHYVQADEYNLRKADISNKIRDTKKANNTINSSKLEDSIFLELKELYPEYNILRNYKENRYPYNCDFYIKDLDLFIELQGYFTHGTKSFTGNKDDMVKLDVWNEKAKESKFFKNAINIWTNKDTEKRQTAKRNKLKFLEIFDTEKLLEQINKVLKGVHVAYTEKELTNEILHINKTAGSINKRPTTNRLIKVYQSNALYHKENEIYTDDPVARRKLIENRIKYLDKKEHTLTNRELLSGFKISGIHRGYSFFSPFWFKYFIEQYDIKSVYDPFGGWGHRLLGTLGTNLEEYIYNDIDTAVCGNCERIYTDYNEYFTTNCTFNNKNTQTFVPNENFDAIFMCPPYDDIEEYSFKNEDFKELMNSIISLYEERDIILGVVIREDFYNIFKGTLGEADRTIPINTNTDHFKTKTQQEKLYIWEKQ